MCPLEGEMDTISRQQAESRSHGSGRTKRPPRRLRSIAEKRQIVEETLQPGASVAVVARRYEVNANLVFGWRKLYQQGILVEATASPATTLLPVNVATPTLVPSERTISPAVTQRPRKAAGAIEIELSGGHRIRVSGRVDRATLTRVIDVVSRR